jgi:hypothetical protein
MKKSFIDLFLIVVNYLYTLSLKNVEIKGTHISDNFWRGHMNENLFIYFQILVHEMSPLHSMLRIHRGPEIMVFH